MPNQQLPDGPEKVAYINDLARRVFAGIRAEDATGQVDREVDGATTVAQRDGAAEARDGAGGARNGAGGAGGGGVSQNGGTRGSPGANGVEQSGANGEAMGGG